MCFYRKGGFAEMNMPHEQTRPNPRRTAKEEAEAGRLKIGDLLRRAGYITPPQMARAVQEMRRQGGRLSSILRKLEYIDEDTVFNFLSRQHNYPPVVIAGQSPARDVLQLLPYDSAGKYFAFPLRRTGSTVHIAMAEPCDDAAVVELREMLGKELALAVAGERDIVEAYKKYYGIGDDEANRHLLTADQGLADESLEMVDDFGKILSEAVDEFEIESTAEERIVDAASANDAPIIKLVNGILVKAVREGVSDVHIEPYEKNMQVRYRKDGVLYKSMNLPLNIKNALVARLKILSGLNITERRVPQDGRIKMRLGHKRSVDFRVSSLPTLFGESVVLRILDKSSLNLDLAQLGFEPETFTMLQRCLARPQGMLLVTGPTGSGKTVTLYSALNALNSENIKILTAEDPVEFNFKGINQVNVHQEVGMTFAAALKAFLRQDPDIIMVGEIRDLETAEIAVRAAMTGHLVFSTLHTNDCAATTSRLVDIGIPPYLLASSLTMVLSQRLGRRLCRHCKKVAHPSREELLLAGFDEKELDGLTVYTAVGCPECNGHGYKGRVGFFELMENSERVAKAISSQLPEEQLRKIAQQEGMTPLRQAALKKVAQGVTSLEEALRHTVAYQERLPGYLLAPDIETYEDGEVIIREGNADQDFFQLMHGSFLMIKDRKTIGKIAPILLYQAGRPWRQSHLIA
jgi:type IV pilus assembly protein PilB